MSGPHGSDSEEEKLLRRMDPYSEKIRVRDTFDSALTPARFWRKLRNYLNERDIEANLDESKWRFNFTVTNELEIEEGVPADSCEMRIDLL